MSFGHQSDVHKHLFAKRALLSHRMVEDNTHIHVVKPVQDERCRLGDPPTKREEPMRTRSNY
jgi:hypothetical protein